MMNPIEYAACRRVLERGDQLCADVEVRIKGRENYLVVLFAESQANDYDMVMVLEKDADRDIDWYDNDLHAAYVDVTEKLFADGAGETHWNPREAFKEQVLSFGDVREQIRQQLKEARLQKV
ncbi:hypothetical protein Elgi_34430 [Paenibacillus elgii]|uniref:hypothetical protein n=1 Tax=Paenibacillus elgii TaxID=189691 RepID=UPI002D7AB0F4|nr:hypothetical protein Elgi_34430 [Paenibacillus elgii]